MVGVVVLIACCWCRCLLLVCRFQCVWLCVVLFGVGHCVLCATCCVKYCVCSSFFVVRGLLVVCYLLLSDDVWRMRFVVWCCVCFVVCSCMIIDFFVGRCRVLLGDGCCLFVGRCGCVVLRSVVSCLLFVVCCLLCVVRCALIVACWLLYVVYGWCRVVVCCGLLPLRVVCCLLFCLLSMHCVADCALWYVAGAAVRCWWLCAVADVRGCMLLCLVFAECNLLCEDCRLLFVGCCLALVMVCVA